MGANTMLSPEMEREVIREMQMRRGGLEKAKPTDPVPNKPRCAISGGSIRHGRRSNSRRSTSKKSKKIKKNQKKSKNIRETVVKLGDERSKYSIKEMLKNDCN